MNLRRLTHLLVVLSGALLASAVSAAAEESGPPVAPTPEVIASDIDGRDVERPPFDLKSERGQTMIDEFAENHGLSSTEGRRVFEDSVPITEFLETHRSDPRFGALWVTYENGYEIHVRHLAEDFSPTIRQLEQAVDRPIVIHHGGASARDLAREPRSISRVKASLTSRTTPAALFECSLTRSRRDGA